MFKQDGNKNTGYVSPRSKVSSNEVLKPGRVGESLVWGKDGSPEWMSKEKQQEVLRKRFNKYSKEELIELLIKEINKKKYV